MNADFRLLHNLFFTAKARFNYCPDREVFGEEEHWIDPSEIRKQLAAQGFVLGDCDDFASLCVMLARQQGIPARFMVCLTEAGEPHAVGEVDGWILDNRQQDVMRRDDLDYSWLVISGFLPGEDWHFINPSVA